MKKLLIGILVISLLFTICACSKERTDISDYQYMYDGIVINPLGKKTINGVNGTWYEVMSEENVGF